MKELLKVIDTPWGKIDSFLIEAAIAGCLVVAALTGYKVCTDEKSADNVGRIVEKVKGDRKANT